MDQSGSQGLSAVEQAAAARKKRLMEMKSRLHGVEMKEEDYSAEGEHPTKKAKEAEKNFRSYKPLDSRIGELDVNSKPKLTAVEDEITEQLRLANDTSAIHHIDIATLAPKKIDWDLKRDIQGKLDKLEKRTQAAIADMIRERLAEGKVDLASAVAAME